MPTKPPKREKTYAAILATGGLASISVLVVAPPAVASHVALLLCSASDSSHFGSTRVLYSLAESKFIALPILYNTR